jgi:hypothetical protein
MKYIERFSSLVPAIQGNMVVRRIEDLKEKGQIQTEAEYNAALQEILSGISTTELKPLFEYTPIQADISSSEHFNLMMDLVRDDLEVLFIELNNIFASIKAHDILFKDKLLDELHFTLRELENEAAKLSVIADAGNAFDEVLLNSFNGDNFSIDRNNVFANDILFDLRKNLRIPNENLGFIDAQEQVISLPLAQEEDIQFTNAAVKTADTTATQVNIQLVDSDINNILDADSASSWAYNILLKDPIKTGAKLSLELDLGDKREINFLRIHPISDFPVLLQKIQYVNINNNIVDLPDTTFFNRTLENPVRITFPDIIAKKIILVLSQSSSILFDYDKNKSEVTFDDLKRNTRLSRSVAILTDNIRETIEDPDLLAILPLAPDIPQSFTVFNQYVFAFRDIATGLSSYRDDGYFVSKAYSRPSLGLVGFDSGESIPKYFDEEAAVQAKASSFEYNIVKKDYNGAGQLIHSSEFPVLPIGATEVENERLFFETGRTVIPLRFIGHSTADSGSGVKIFRNNTEITLGLDWRFFDRLNPINDSDTNLKTNLLETKIEILHSSDVTRSGIYTAQYIPRHINEPDEVVTIGGITFLPTGVTEHPIKRGIETVESSDSYVKIAIRNNSIFINKTPKLDFYRLLVSSVDSNKYVRV